MWEKGYALRGETHTRAEEPTERRANRPEDLHALLPGGGGPGAGLGPSPAGGYRHREHGKGEHLNRPVFGM